MTVKTKARSLKLPVIAVLLFSVTWITTSAARPEPALPPTVKIKGPIVSYDHASVKDIMQAITYFYRIPVVYKESKPSGKTLSGSVNRQLKIEGMLKMLQHNGVNVRYDGTKIIVAE